jgi:hypothetical protein
MSIQVDGRVRTVATPDSLRLAHVLKWLAACVFTQGAQRTGRTASYAIGSAARAVHVLGFGEAHGAPLSILRLQRSKSLGGT